MLSIFLIIMKLLLFSDVHLSKMHCQQIARLSEDVDIVVGAGDYCSLRNDLDKAIGWLSTIKKPTLLVPGNAESFEELQHECASWSSASGKPNSFTIARASVTLSSIGFSS